MKNLYKVTLFFLILFIASACSDFETINTDPSVADPNGEAKENILPSDFLAKSIYEAQQNPHIQDRIFVRFWKGAARFERRNNLCTGEFNNDWIEDYYSASYALGWLTNANLAVNIAKQRLLIESDPEIFNVLQMSRIWRAYLIAELLTGIGPTVIEGEYVDQETAYSYILSELKDAVQSIDKNYTVKQMANSDYLFKGAANKWAKYGNSLRMRYAMLLSNIAPSKAQQEFEDAAKDGESSLLTDALDIAEVAEKDEWGPLAGVMSRSWNIQAISATYNNLVVGLGGQNFPVPDSLKPYLKNPHSYLGLLLDKHFPLMTNDPCAGYFFDGIPQKIDPRAAVTFNIPGYSQQILEKDIYYTNSWPSDSVALLDPNNTTKTLLKIRGKYSWSAWVAGEWGEKRSLTQNLLPKDFSPDETNDPYSPRLSVKYRESRNKRVWFAGWETYFLLAEAKLYGWNLGKTVGAAEDFYKKGIENSFKYHGVSQFVNDYLNSEDYNRVGTSVKFTHTNEATNYTINYINGYDGKPGTKTYEYPKNSIYKNGTVNNDQLTKIITQKYLAQVPWLPLEAWTDHRRLGLPFMENPAVEIDYPQGKLPLTKATSKETRKEFYPRRYPFPISLKTKNEKGYTQILKFLGGTDNVMTPLWWDSK